MNPIATISEYRIKVIGKPVWENLLSAPTRAAIFVNGDSGSTPQRTCTQ